MDVEAATEKKIQEKKAASKVDGFEWLSLPHVPSILYNEGLRFNEYGRFECLMNKDCTPKVDFLFLCIQFPRADDPNEVLLSTVLRRKLKLSQKPRKRRSQKLRSRTQIFWIVFWKQVDTKLWNLRRPFAFRKYTGTPYISHHMISFPCDRTSIAIYLLRNVNL